MSNLLRLLSELVGDWGMKTEVGLYHRLLEVGGSWRAGMWKRGRSSVAPKVRNRAT